MVSSVQKLISGESLVPISLVLSGAISFGGSIYYIAQVAAMASESKGAIERIEDRSQYNEDKLSQIMARVSAVDAKLDLLIDIQHSQERFKRERKP
jgi:hypothetical protein